MIEAMAAGTPVIAWDCGSTREVIDEGVSGFLVDSIDEAVAAVEAAGGMARDGRSRRVRGPLHRRAHGARLCSAVRAADRGGEARSVRKDDGRRLNPGRR